MCGPNWFCSRFEGKLNQFRNFGIWIVIALLLVALFSLFQSQSMRGSTAEISYSDFLDKVSSGSVKSFTYTNGTISAKEGDKALVTYGPLSDADLKMFRDKKVEMNFRPPQGESMLSNFLIWWLPMILLGGVWFFFMRQMQSGSGKAMGFGKSKAKLLTEKQGRVTFEDVAGVDEAKDDLQEIVEFL